MMEFLVAILLTPYAIIGVLLIGALFDHGEVRFVSFLALLVAGFLAFHTYETSITNVFIGLGVWILIGLVYSWLAWSHQCKQAVKMFDSNRIAHHQAVSLALISDNKARVTYWVLAWPISVFARISGNFFSLIGNSIQYVFGNMYRAISDNSINQIKKIDEDRRD